MTSHMDTTTPRIRITGQLGTEHKAFIEALFNNTLSNYTNDKGNCDVTKDYKIFPFCLMIVRYIDRFTPLFKGIRVFLVGLKLPTVVLKFVSTSERNISRLVEEVDKFYEEDVIYLCKDVVHRSPDIAQVLADAIQGRFMPDLILNINNERLLISVSDVSSLSQFMKDFSSSVRVEDEHLSDISENSLANKPQGQRLYSEHPSLVDKAAETSNAGNNCDYLKSIKPGDNSNSLGQIVTGAEANAEGTPHGGELVTPPVGECVTSLNMKKGYTDENEGLYKNDRNSQKEKGSRVMKEPASDGLGSNHKAGEADKFGANRNEDKDRGGRFNFPPHDKCPVECKPIRDGSYPVHDKGQGECKPIRDILRIDSDILSYIRLFCYDELHSLVDSDGSMIDDTEVTEGKLYLVTFGQDGKQKTGENVRKIKQYTEELKCKVTYLSVDITSVRSKEENIRHIIFDMARKNKVKINLSNDGLFLVLLGNKEVVCDVSEKIHKMLGLTYREDYKYKRNRSHGNQRKQSPIQQGQGQGFSPMRTAPIMSFYHVKSGVIVHAEVNDITKMSVDVIVNAANEDLHHCGGVALAISQAGGSVIDRESRQFTSNHGKLAVTDTCVTSAGKMPSSMVIHTVGPQWDINQAEVCLKQLHHTFTNVLSTAVQHHHHTIAIPAISSGVYGMPISIVADTAVTSITKYLTKHPDSPLREVHLVGIDSDIVRDIQQEMEKQVRAGNYTICTGMIRPCEVKEKAGIHGHSGTDVAVNRPIDQITNSDTSKTANNTTTACINLKDENIDDCCICMCPPDNPKTLPKCKHTFCSDCIDRGFKIKPVCPVCGEIYGDITGDQPEDGRMEVTVDKHMALPGYEGYGTIWIEYFFPDGKQTSTMTSPGSQYTGTYRIAYLPDNTEGNKVLKLLQTAFKARLIFTVGSSRTTGAQNTVTWNDIHHKTSTYGGPSKFGYPDPDYLTRVQEELAAKGIK